MKKQESKRLRPNQLERLLSNELSKATLETAFAATPSALYFEATIIEGELRLEPREDRTEPPRTARWLERLSRGLAQLRDDEHLLVFDPSVVIKNFVRVSKKRFNAPPSKWTVMNMSSKQLMKMVQEPDNFNSMQAAIAQAPDALFFMCHAQRHRFEINAMDDALFRQVFRQTPGVHAEIEKAIEGAQTGEKMFMFQLRNGNAFLYFSREEREEDLCFRDSIFRGELNGDKIMQEARKHAGALIAGMKHWNEAPIILLAMSRDDAKVYAIPDLDMLAKTGLLGKLSKGITPQMVPESGSTDCLVIFLSGEGNGVMSALCPRDEKSMFANMSPGGDA